LGFWWDFFKEQKAKKNKPKEKNVSYEKKIRAKKGGMKKSKNESSKVRI